MSHYKECIVLSSRGMRTLGGWRMCFNVCWQGSFVSPTALQGQQQLPQQQQQQLDLPGSAAGLAKASSTPSIISTQHQHTGKAHGAASSKTWCVCVCWLHDVWRVCFEISSDFFTGHKKHSLSSTQVFHSHPSLKVRFAKCVSAIRQLFYLLDQFDHNDVGTFGTNTILPVKITQTEIKRYIVVYKCFIVKLSVLFWAHMLHLLTNKLLRM